MLRKLLSVLIACVALALPASTLAAKSYSAERYDVRLVLQPGGILNVTETIAFRFEGGPFTEVFRDLAYTELDQIDQIEAAMDGQALPMGSGPGQVEIGSGRPLHVSWHLAPTSDARHTFTLTYRVLGAVRQGEADALIWRAIPQEHDYAIANATVALAYPPSIRPLDVPTLKPAGNAEASEAGIAFALSGLGADEDVVISARFPAGSLISSPPAWQARQAAQAAAMARAWPGGIAAGLLSLAAAGAGLSLAARANRRESPVDRPVPSGIAPSDLPPALVGRLTGQSAIFMGTLFDLAQGGWLEIYEQSGWLGSKRYRLALTPSDAPLRPHEQALLDTLFKPGQTAIAMSDVPTRLAGTSAFDRQVDAELAGYNWVDPRRKAARSRQSVLWLLGLFGSIALFLGGVVLGGALSGGTVAGLGRDSLILPGVLAGIGAGLFLASIAGLVYAGSLSPLTDAGEREAARWQGFGLYLKAVSRGREPAVRADDFERYLPLAATFGLGASWAKYFQSLGGVPLPAWFQAAAGSAGDFGAIIAVMAASDSAGAASAGGGAGASGGGASGAH